jgi:large conductance mechanosensitive channel
VIDLGVGVVMGIAFKSVVDSLVADMLTPLIAIIGGNTDFSAMNFTINGSQFIYGNFINVMISFVITALVVFYFVITPTNHVISRYATEETPEPTTRKCPFCVSEIAKVASRCPHCTAEIEPVIAA